MNERKQENNSQTELPLQASPDASSADDQESGATLEWVSHPVKRRPLVSVAVSVFIIACCAITFISTNSTWFAGLALAILIGSLAKFYFPTRYRLSPKGVTIKTTTQTLTKEWRLYRSCYPDRNGILLSPFEEPSRLENFRGLYLIFNNNADDVTSFVRRHIASNDGSTTDGARA